MIISHSHLLCPRKKYMARKKCMVVIVKLLNSSLAQNKYGLPDNQQTDLNTSITSLLNDPGQTSIDLSQGSNHTISY